MMTLKSERLHRILLSQKLYPYLKREEQRKEDVTTKVGGIYKLMSSYFSAKYTTFLTRREM